LIANQLPSTLAIFLNLFSDFHKRCFTYLKISISCEDGIKTREFFGSTLKRAVDYAQSKLAAFDTILLYDSSGAAMRKYYPPEEIRNAPADSVSFFATLRGNVLTVRVVAGEDPDEEFIRLMSLEHDGERQTL